MVDEETESSASDVAPDEGDRALTLAAAGERWRGEAVRDVCGGSEVCRGRECRGSEYSITVSRMAEVISAREV